MRQHPLAWVLAGVLMMAVGLAGLYQVRQMSQPRAVVVRFTDGPTVISTQVVRLDNR